MNIERKPALLNTLLFTLMVVVNALANALPINGLSTGDVAALYPSRFTPAGITFSIWSVIYILLLGFVIFQWKNMGKKYYGNLSRLFQISCVLNISWILVWHYLLPLISVIVMLAFLFVLIRIFLLLQQNPQNSVFELVCVHLPFTIYLAWISVATIANISAYLTSINWDGGPLSDIAWTVIMMGVATILGVYMLIRFKAYAFSIVIMWALIGISLRDQPHVTHAGVALIVIVFLSMLYRFFKRRPGISL